MAISPYVRQLREALGQTRLFLPSAAGLVRADGNRLLLVQDRETLRWTTPGGVMELDETPAEAVVREVWEEAGLLVRPRALFGVYGGPKFLVRYPNGDETVAVRYFTLDEARQLPMSPWLIDVLPRLYEPASVPWFESTAWRPPAG